MPTPPLPIAAPDTASRHPANDVIVFEEVSIAFEDNVVPGPHFLPSTPRRNKGCLRGRRLWEKHDPEAGLGLIKPDRGHIYTLGEDITSMPEEQLFELRRKVGIVFRRARCSIH